MNDSRMEKIGAATAGIAHDINNQLTLIVNHLSLACVDPEKTDKKMLEGARKAAERCAELTASLLSYCKGNQLELSSLSPADFLRGFIGGISLPDGIDLKAYGADSLPKIAANPLALTRVLTNLITNACEAMEGRGTIRILATPRKIVVEDSGPGVSKAHARRIFEPFYSTKRVDGTGLGLSIVRQLMHQQGGSVTIQSQPGQGATFTLRFRSPSERGVTGRRA